MYIIGFNGPPRSGKDSIASEIHRRYDVEIPPTQIKSLSRPMRLIGFAMLGLEYTPPLYELIKDRPQGIFAGKTLREFMIEFAEHFAKPWLGKEVWGKVLIKSLPAAQLHSDLLLLIPDIGFQEETDYLQDVIGVTKFLLVCVSREGIDWANDSRGYVHAFNSLWIQNQKIEDSALLVLTHAKAKLGWSI